MNTFSGWIKHYQVTAFFIITFAITWGLGFSYGAILKGFCKAFWIAFLAAWFTSTLVCLANFTIIESIPLSPAAVVLFMVAVVPVAFVIASAYSRNPSVRSYLASFIQLRGMWGWSLLALVSFLILLLISFPVNSLLNMHSIPPYQFPEISLALIGLVVVKFFYQFFFFNATGEEAGWRGFALPRLQARIRPLVDSLIIALFWINWHWFLWQAEGNPVFFLPILDHSICAPHSRIGDHRLVLEPQQGENPGVRYRPRRCQYCRWVFLTWFRRFFH
jgi:membrane protease YdiL (CAAX protease family)